MSVEERIKNIVAHQLKLNPEEIAPQSTFFENLGMDSLGAIELTMVLEEEFGIEIPDEDAEKLLTVGDVIKYIEEKIRE